jgi:hypothetical protein
MSRIVTARKVGMMTAQGVNNIIMAKEKKPYTKSRCTIYMSGCWL